MYNIGGLFGTIELQDNASQGLKEFQKSASDTQKAMLALGAGITAAFAAVTAATIHTANLRDEQTKLARSMGVSTEEFGKLNYAAKMSGVSTEVLGKSIRGLRAPSADAASELARLGVGLTDANGKGKSASTMLGDIAERFKNMSAADRATSAVQLFGNRAAEMTNLLADGKAGLQALGDEAVKLGIVFDAEAGRNAELFADNLERLKFATDGVTQAVGASVIEFVNETGVMEAVTDAIADVTAWINSLDKDTKKFIITAGLVVVGITAFIAAGTALTAIGPAVGAALTAMTGPFLPLVLLLGAIAAGVVLLITHWSEFKQVMAPVIVMFEKLKATLSQAWDSIADTLSPLFDKLKGLFSGLDTSKISVVDITLKSIATVIAVIIFNLNQMINSFKLLGGAAEDFGRLLIAALTGDKNGITKHWDNLQKNFSQNLGKMSDDAKAFALSVEQIWSTQTISPPRINKEEAEKDGNEAGIRAREGFDAAFGGGGGEGETTGFLQKLADIDTGSIESMGNDIGGMLGGGIADMLGSSGVMGMIGSSIGGILGQAGTIAKGWLDMQMKLWEAEIAKYQNEAKKMEFIFMLGGKMLEKQHETELEQITSHFDEIIEETQNFYIRKREIEDEEFAAVKAQLESVKQARIAAMLTEVEEQKGIYSEKSVHETDRILGLAQFDLDAKEKQKQIEADFNQQLTAETQKKAAKEVSLKKQEDDQVKLLENQKNTALEKAEESHNARMKEEKKKAALTKYFYDNMALQVQKQMATVQANLSYAQSVMSAIQAGAMMAATIPIAGLVLGPALTAGLISMATVGYHATLGMIHSQFVMPPAELFADGGFVRGPGGPRDDRVNARLSNGEFVVNAASTQRNRQLLEAINSNTLPDNGGSMIPVQNIIFEPGAIVIEGVYDDRVVDFVSARIGEEIAARV